MSLFAGLFFSAKAPDKFSGKKELVYLMGSAKFDVEIVGDEDVQPTLEIICSPHRPQGANCYETASFKLENDKAVRVEILGKKIGSLTPQAASFFRQQLITRGIPKGVGQCAAVIRGGSIDSDGRKRPYKVWLDLPI